MLNNLRAIRKAQKMTQRELSERSHVNRINIAQYENCQKNPNLSTAQKLAEALGVKIDDLIGKAG